MGIGNIIKSSIIPIIAIVLIDIVAALLSNIPLLGGFILCIIILPQLAINAVALTYAGFSGTKSGLGLGGAAAAGALAGFASALVNSIIRFVIVIIAGGAFTAISAVTSNDPSSGILGGLLGTGISAGFGIIGIIIAPFIWAAIGAVMGALGSLIAGKPK
jgi:hypothetical protein